MKMSAKGTAFYDNLHSFYSENLAHFIQKWYDLDK